MLNIQMRFSQNAWFVHDAFRNVGVGLLKVNKNGWIHVNTSVINHITVYFIDIYEETHFLCSKTCFFKKKFTNFCEPKNWCSLIKAKKFSRLLQPVSLWLMQEIMRNKRFCSSIQQKGMRFLASNLILAPPTFETQSRCETSILWILTRIFPSLCFENLLNSDETIFIWMTCRTS